MFHQPFWGTGGSADAYALYIFEPGRVYLLWSLYQVAVGIHPETLLIEHPAVAALSATYKEHQIVLTSKLRHVGHTVCHLSANGIKTLKHCGGSNLLLDIVDDSMKLVERLGGLRIEVDVFVEVELCHILKMSEHNGFTFGLPHQSQHFCMSGFAKDHYLCIGILVALLFDAPLQLQHHWTGCIYDLYAIAFCHQVGFGWFAVGSEQYFHTMQLCHLLMVDGFQAHSEQSFTLHTVVHDISQAIEGIAFCQFLLSLVDGSGHSKAKATAAVYFYL